MKTCNKCHKTKPLDKFHKSKTGKYGRRSWCKDCANKHDKDYYHNGGGKEKRGRISMYKNKNCAHYLGIVVAERLIKHLFNDVVMMPFGHPGYDMICNRGKKINVKASTINARQNKNSIMKSWKFNINYNKKCDFYLLMAFDDVINLTPLFAWMVPGNEVSNKSGLRISLSNIHRWDDWKIDLDNAQACCDLMKEKNKKNFSLELTVLA